MIVVCICFIFVVFVPGLSDLGPERPRAHDACGGRCSWGLHGLASGCASEACWVAVLV